MTPFATGKAQPQQSPYATSTPYAPGGKTTKFGNTTLNQTYSQGATPYEQPKQAPTSPTDGNWANYAGPGRPPAFTAQYGNYQGGYSPQRSTNTRDAFIQQINNQAGRATDGPPQFDIAGAWGQAGQMVADGWQNPFAQPPQAQLRDQGHWLPQPKRSRQELAGDFYDPNPDGPKMMVEQSWHNPKTGEQFSGTGMQPRPGAGWVAGESPLAVLRQELADAEYNAANPRREWDAATDTYVEPPPGAADQYAQRAELLRRQIAEMEANPGQDQPQMPRGGASPGSRSTPPASPGRAQPIQDPRATSTPYGGYADPYLNFVAQTMPQHLAEVLAKRRRNGIGDDGKHFFWHFRAAPRPTVDRSAANATSLANVKALAQRWKTK